MPGPGRPQRAYTDEELADACDFIDAYLENHRYAPTLDEIGEHLGYSSKSTTWFHIEVARRRGWLDQIVGQNRTIHTTDKYRKEKKGIRK